MGFKCDPLKRTLFFETPLGRESEAQSITVTVEGYPEYVESISIEPREGDEVPGWQLFELLNIDPLARTFEVGEQFVFKVHAVVDAQWHSYINEWVHAQIVARHRDTITGEIKPVRLMYVAVEIMPGQEPTARVGSEVSTPEAAILGASDAILQTWIRPFTIENVGAEPLRIDRVRDDPPFQVVDYDQECPVALGPGEKLKVFVEFRPTRTSNPADPDCGELFIEPVPPFGDKSIKCCGHARRHIQAWLWVLVLVVAAIAVISMGILFGMPRP